MNWQRELEQSARDWAIINDIPEWRWREFTGRVDVQVAALGGCILSIFNIRRKL